MSGMRETTGPHVLVAGAGIAGTTLAVLLTRRNIPVTVVERSPAPRPGGQAVDIRGASHQVIARMGLMPSVHTHQIDERGMCYVNGQGRVWGRMSMELLDGKGAVAEIEIARGDFHRVLLDELDTAGAAAEVHYGDHVQTLEQDPAGVSVRFASGRTGRYDLVVGADGVHSAMRRMAFGPDAEFSSYLGGYAAYFTMPTPADHEQGWFAMRLVPGIAIGIRPDKSGSTSKAVLILRRPRDPALRRDRHQQEALIRSLVAGSGWHADSLLTAMTASTDFYFDELLRIEVPNLVQDRIALLGDAGYSGSPLSGRGTATALVGAQLLADAIAAHPQDARAALRSYATQVAPFAETGRTLTGGGIAMMVPRTWFAATLMRLSVQVMLSRPFRPIAARVFLGTQADEPELPTRAQHSPAL